MILDEKTTREALKCCTDNKDRCSECPLDRLITCKEQLILSVSNLVNQLDEDKAAIRDSTVMEMHTEISTRCIKGGIYPAFVKSTVNQVTREMLGVEDVSVP